MAVQVVTHVVGRALLLLLTFPSVWLSYLHPLQGPKVFFDSAKDCVPEDTLRWEEDKLIVELVSACCEGCDPTARVVLNKSSDALSFIHRQAN